jgi:two-component system response regulator RegX3
MGQRGFHMTAVSHQASSLPDRLGRVELEAVSDPAVRILVVERDEELAKWLHHVRENEGYAVEISLDLLDGLRTFVHDPPDVVLLETRVPRVASVEVCRRMNASAAAVPVIMCSDVDDTLDRAGAVKLGGTDHLTKPYDPSDLVARIEAVRRPADARRGVCARSAPAVLDDGMTIGALQVDFAAREVRRHGRPVHLPRREFDLLSILLSPPGQLRSRGELAERLWSGRCVPGSRTLDTHIRRLRIKLEDDPARPRHLVTVRGVGFRFEVGSTAVSLRERSATPA